MGPPPAVIIVARHGARLDAADAQWHLTSPAPYDPPLTYRGWTQCRTLGVRIGGLLQARAELFQQTQAEQEEKTNGTTHDDSRQRKRRVKKHRVIIHSSPFLRCIQTSIAISAGISQHHGMEEEVRLRSEQQDDITKAESSDIVNGHTERRREPVTDLTTTQPSTYFKPRLRIDAFLGEWLSPDYYESITPPPGSVLMVAGAKAALLRRGEYIDTEEDPARLASMKGNFPGGWGSNNESETTETSGDQQTDLSASLSDISIKTSAGRDQTQTHGRTDSSTNTKRSNGDTSKALGVTGHPSRGYIPPIPRYAISPSDAIPRGYEHHARDACISVDYQWDSMRAPQDWGNGGEYGEEWSSMHRRFRKGLQSMVAWYTLHHESPAQQGGHARVLHPEHTDDEDTDLVLVLVTHGAGCNALIGALTNQPVLLDVPMASLTMAVRKDNRDKPDKRFGHSPTPTTVPPPLSSPSTTSPPRSPLLPRYVNDHPLSTEYTVSLTASTDHLTQSAAATPFSSIPSTPNSSSQPATATSSPRIAPRRRFDFNPSPLHDRAVSLSHLTSLPSSSSSSSSSSLSSSQRTDLSLPAFPANPTPRFGVKRSNTGAGPSTRPSQASDRAALASTGLWRKTTDSQQPTGTWSGNSAWSTVGGGSVGGGSASGGLASQGLASRGSASQESATRGSENGTATASEEAEIEKETQQGKSAKGAENGHREINGVDNGCDSSANGDASANGDGDGAHAEEDGVPALLGLWGGKDEITARAGGSKRRWTVTERS